MTDEIRIDGWVEVINEMPIPPSGIRAAHGVPWGRVFRQWDTRGRLWLWVNRGWLEDLPRAKPLGPGLEIITSPLCPPSVVGIQVYYE